MTQRLPRPRTLSGKVTLKAECDPLSCNPADFNYHGLSQFFGQSIVLPENASTRKGQTFKSSLFFHSSLR